MADFKLSRIRFNWKSTWVSGTDYIVDDMIEHNGFTYVALRTHASADFYNDLSGTDLTPAKPKWKKQSEGKSWLGNWGVATAYKLGNIVKYGASVYECTEAHTSAATFSSATDGLVADINKWTLVAVSSADWKYNWTINTLYRINDLARYNGKVYKCTAQHVSAATTLLGLEADQPKWSVLSDSDTWRGTWSIGTRYKVNDIVKYGGIVYKCVNGHVSADNTTLGLEEDQAKWEMHVDGIEYVVKNLGTTPVTYSGAWQVGYRYKKNDVVKRGGNLLKAVSGHTSSVGDDGFKVDQAAGKWSIYLPGSEYENAWSEAVYYQPGDMVLYGGYIYKSLSYNVGYKPAQYPTDWNVTFEGYNFRNEWNDAGSETSSTIIEYRTGDIVRLTGNLYIAIQDSTNLQPDQWPTYWEHLVDGRQFRDTWEDNQEYYKGDIVTWAGTSYTCLKYHRSTESASRPDMDVEQPDQNFWKIMILGTRTNKLARKGDLKTFDNQDSTAIDTVRLAAGTTGQILRATTRMPMWDTFDLQQKVYYVSENGVDDESQGGTLNAPFRTVGFACTYLLRNENTRVGTGAKINVLAGDYPEILPISIPAHVAIVGAELRTTTIRPAELGRDTVLSERTTANPVQTAINISSNNQNQNMFLVRNGTGIRDCTLKGLTGTLGTANTYGTKRPTGGAFVSLDPGTGPADSSTWIATTNKMQYTPTAGTYAPATGVMTLTIPNTQYTPQTGTTYDPVTGLMKLVLGSSHGLQVGEEVSVDANSLTFSCSYGYGEHIYTGGTVSSAITITAGNVSKDVTMAWYNHQTGILEMQIGSHAFTTADTVTIGTDKLTFTCEADNHATTHTYPRATDPAAGSAIAITSTTGSTISCNVGAVPKQTNHTYPRISDPMYGETRRVVAADATSITINCGISSNQTTHTFISANAGAVNWTHNIKKGNAITIDANSLTWTCAMDGHGSDHTYPRTTDPYYNKNIQITNVAGNVITFNIGISSNTSAHTFKSSAANSINMERIQAGKSPYIQGVTTIGDNCVGLKIDGSLHNGGNKSCVANDFTQVLSDGIGYWATNLGRSELVSVFTYYAHIGYLSENGGILRATNGNNSYGTFGSVAEGFDSTETPQTVTVNNRSGEASVEDPWVGSTSVLALAYGNNGQSYTNVTPSVTQASGTGLDMRWDEIRNGAIDKITLDLPPLGDSTNMGGRGYKFAANNAQGGDTDQITLAASETRTAAQMNGLRILIKGGVGSGQYGYIWNYDPASKVAMVYRESDNQPGWDNIVPGKVPALTLDATTEYEYEPRVSFTEPPYNQTNNSVASGTLDIGYSDSLGMFYYAVPGTATWYVSTDGSLWTERNTSASLGAKSWTRFSAGGMLIAGVANNDTVMGFSNDGIVWDTSTLPEAHTWTGVQLGGSDGKTLIVCGDGTSKVYRARLTTDGTSTVVPSTWTNPTANTTDHVGIAYGQGKWIAMGKTGTTSISTDDGLTWSAGAAVTLDGTEEYSDLVYGNNCWVASLDNADRIIYSSDGSNWYDSGLVGDSGREDWKIAYKQGVFLAVSATGTTLSSDNGYTWKIRSTNGNLTHIVGGTKNNMPAFVGLNSGTTGNIITAGARAIGRVEIANGKIDKFKLYDPGSGYAVSPTITIYDPEEYGEPYYTATIKDGVLPQPSFYNRGSGYQSAIITLTGDGFAEELQIGNTMKVSGVSLLPGPGSNFRISGQDDVIYKMVKVTGSSGVSPNIEMTFQISPLLTRATAPAHGTSATLRERYSQVRLTGHDFLDIGSGNFTNTNYPGLYLNNETRKVLTAADGTTYNPTTGVLLLEVGVDHGVNIGDHITIADNALSFQCAEDNYTTTHTYPRSTDPMSGERRIVEGVTSTTIQINCGISSNLTSHVFQSSIANTIEAFTTFEAVQASETKESNGGRVFYTSTDQDGNYRVGELFKVSQAQGGVTLSADFFDLTGLSEIRLGGISLGGSQAIIREFSTDNTFVASSNNILPTQRALKSYIENRFSGGGANLFTNELTAGQIKISSRSIDNTAGANTPDAMTTVSPLFTVNGPLGGGLQALNMFFGARTERDDFNG